MWRLKDFRDRVENKFGKFTYEELKVREVTDEKPWGPASEQMHEIADMTYKYESFDLIMNMLFYRIVTDPVKSWRRVYKSLLLLDHLIRNGSDKVINYVRQNEDHLKTIKLYRYIDDEGKDQTINITHRLQEILSLVEDDDKLKLQRRTAKELRKRFSENSVTYSSFPTYQPSKTTSSGGTFLDAISDTFDKLQKYIPSSNVFAKQKKDIYNLNSPSISTYQSGSVEKIRIYKDDEEKDDDKSNSKSIEVSKKVERSHSKESIDTPSINMEAVKKNNNLICLDELFNSNYNNNSQSNVVNIKNTDNDESDLFEPFQDLQNPISQQSGNIGNNKLAKPLQGYNDLNLEITKPASYDINNIFDLQFYNNNNQFTNFQSQPVKNYNNINPVLNKNLENNYINSIGKQQSVDNKQTKTAEQLMDSNLKQFLSGMNQSVKK